MERAATILLCLMALAFVTSGALFALADNPINLLIPDIGTRATGTLLPDDDSLAGLYLRPRHPATWILLFGLWLMLIASTLRQLWLIPSGRYLALADVALLIAALAAGTVWPWVAVQAPLAGFIICVTMLLALIAAAKRKDSDGRLERSPVIGAFTGWATVLTFGAFATFLSNATMLPIELAAVVGAMLTCGAAIAIQLWLPRNAAYTLTVMFALLASAATTIDANPPLAVIAVLSISALTFLLVRVTT